MLDLLPEMILCSLHLVALRIALDLGEDHVDLLHLKVYDIVHDALSPLHVLLELVEIELRLRREGVYDVAVQIEAKQTTAVVRTQGDLTTRIGAHRTEA